MTFLQLYTTPDVGYMINQFLDVDDDLRLDSTCTDVRKTHREDIYPRYKTFNIDAVASWTKNRQAYMSYEKKLLKYVEHLTCTYNINFVLMPPLDQMPKIKSIHYAVPLSIETTRPHIDSKVFALWKSVETLALDLARPDTNHPLEAVCVHPGEILLTRTRDGECVSEQWLHDSNETTHQQMYRRLAYPTYIVIPNNLYHIHFCLPGIMLGQPWPNIHTWSWDEPDSVGMLVLNLALAMERGHDDDDW